MILKCKIEDTDNLVHMVSAAPDLVINLRMAAAARQDGMVLLNNSKLSDNEAG